MRPRGTPAELERRRLTAIQRLLEGHPPEDVADILGVTRKSLRRWLAAFQRDGPGAVAAKPAQGRPPKLSSTQEKIILRWLNESPVQFGFSTDLWTGRRLSQLIEEEFGVRLDFRYLSDWLRQRGITPQKPQRVPRERDPERIAKWIEADWPRIKKK